MTSPSIKEDRRDVLHAMLVALRDETYQRVRELRHEQEEDTEPAPTDEMDRARGSIDVETHASLIARAEERLRYLDEALGRVDADSYGICAACRKPIGVQRLAAVPFAVYCVDCQRSRVRAEHGWADGAAIQPYDQQWTLPQEMEQQPEYTAGSQEVRAVSGGGPFAQNEESLTPASPERKTHPRKK